MSELIQMLGHFAPLSGILQTGWESALFFTGTDAFFQIVQFRSTGWSQCPLGLPGTGSSGI
jgi:hypothetical protein